MQPSGKRMSTRTPPSPPSSHVLSLSLCSTPIKRDTPIVRVELHIVNVWQLGAWGGRLVGSSAQVSLCDEATQSRGLPPPLSRSPLTILGAATARISIPCFGRMVVRTQASEQETGSRFTVPLTHNAVYQSKAPSIRHPSSLAPHPSSPPPPPPHLPGHGRRQSAP